MCVHHTLGHNHAAVYIHSVHTVYTTQYTPHSIHHTVYTTQYTHHSIHITVYTTHCLTHTVTAQHSTPKIQMVFSAVSVSYNLLAHQHVLHPHTHLHITHTHMCCSSPHTYINIHNFTFLPTHTHPPSSSLALLHHDRHPTPCLHLFQTPTHNTHHILYPERFR